MVTEDKCSSIILVVVSISKNCYQHINFFWSKRIFKCQELDKLKTESPVAELVKNLPAVQETLLLLGSRNSVPGSGKFAGEAIGYPLQYSWASLLAQLVKKSICNVGDLGSIPGLGRSLGEGKGYPLQYSGLENFMDCVVHGVAKSHIRLSDLHFHFTFTFFQDKI